MAAKQRLDVLLTERGLASSRTQAQALLMAGKVRMDGVLVSKPGTRVSLEVELTCIAPPPYVSRGGHKLAGALDDFKVDPTDLSCLDAGASTGGFTDCLLQRGARHVIAADVGYGQLAEKLVTDPRVTVMDRTNVRHLTPADLGCAPDAVQLIVGDLSFISLDKVLPALKGLLAPDGIMVLLVKPQFEVGRENIGKGGIVRNEAAREAAVAGVAATAQRLGLIYHGHTTSAITGAKGNVEYLIHLTLI